MAVGTSEDDCCHSQTKRQVHHQQPGDNYMQAEQTCRDTDVFHHGSRNQAGILVGPMNHQPVMHSHGN